TVATVTLDMMAKAGATEDDCDDLAGLAGRAEESVVSITIKEQADGNCKISVRSNPEVSSSQICAVFGGGGHDMAAGCTIMGTPEKARELLLQVIDEVWK
ncbi:MAG: phosphoesterase RecJ domain-containing protein, partial [Oscillospiraceae bacterium]|nr:phosphoesterase RecJ domain-containing protein [Oscillospiraceae bacterium]